MNIITCYNKHIILPPPRYYNKLGIISLVNLDKVRNEMNDVNALNYYLYNL